MSERFYQDTHEWARLDGGEVVVGLSVFAAGEIGDVIHIELPQVGRVVKQGEGLAEIESVKSVNDFYSPVAGRVTSVNQHLAAHPEILNQDPLESGWVARLAPTEPHPLLRLVNEATYQSHLESHR